MKVAKFGGSSVADASMIKKVAQIIMSDDDRKFIVVSAPGKRYSSDIKVTDLLVELGERFVNAQPVDEVQAKIVERFQTMIENLSLSESILDDIKETIDTVLHDDRLEDNRLDALKAMGEDSLAKILSAYLQSLGKKATYMNPRDAGIIVSDEPGSAQVLDESYELLAKLRNHDGIMIIPGFFGYTKDQKLTTFPRGGSDITGAIVAAGVKAKLYENFTDVDSVFCVNPTIVDNPKEIKELTYKEMRELSYAGFSVFHDEALIPAFKAKIPVCIKNTNNPEKEGTMIVSNREQGSTGTVVGIASDKGFLSLYVSKYLMNREIGFGKNLLQILVDEGISFEHAPSGIDDMSVIIREDELPLEKEQVVIERIKNELDVDMVAVERDLAMIMLVGEGMNSTYGVASRSTQAFANACVNIEMINQGSSEVSVMFGIKEEAMERAVQSLYEEFFES
ncbi:aspartate kinase [Salinibacillus xinjiangensis]|uniref:Aspartokinase n=1 Tax=Salinibacillus xinjiangensis TaxID=1229268 RepID=A0A6G1X697_9BACI|nr:aspartate kinase [Salinibacillus xinjiangensis]MRG86523.1 aspartate kinase [Salinibacillus xinjiangensis]